VINKIPNYALWLIYNVSVHGKGRRSTKLNFQATIPENKNRDKTPKFQILISIEAADHIYVSSDSSGSRSLRYVYTGTRTESSWPAINKQRRKNMFISTSLIQLILNTQNIYIYIYIHIYTYTYIYTHTRALYSLCIGNYVCRRWETNQFEFKPTTAVLTRLS
jgi:hypothetical protein